MDLCLGYCIMVMGKRFLICAANAQPADVLFAVAQEPRDYYLHLFDEVHPQVFVPIHWDDFTRALGKPLRRLNRPGRMPLWQLAGLARKCLPSTQVIIPEIFKEYDL